MGNRRVMDNQEPRLSGLRRSSGRFTLDWMSRSFRRKPTLRDRVVQLEATVAQLGEVVISLQQDVAERAPASEIERLNYGFELIADRAPASEIERLNYAFELIADRAPLTEVQRVDEAFGHIGAFEAAQIALRQDLEARADRIAKDVRRDSERIDAVLQEVMSWLSDQDDDRIIEFTRHLESRFDAVYLRFESLYRGPREEIIGRLRAYEELVDLDMLKELGPAVDLGSGRGEWIEFLNDQGFEVYGVDLNRDLVEMAEDRGLRMVNEDLVGHLRSLAPGSVSLVSMFHVAEHLNFETLADVIRAAYLAIIPGGSLIIETPNPTNLLVGAASFYLDPTHLKPIHPSLLQFLVEELGFQTSGIHYLNPGGDAPLAVPKSLRDEPEGVRLVQILNEMFFSPQDFAIVATKQ